MPILDGISAYEKRGISAALTAPLALLVVSYRIRLVSSSETQLAATPCCAEAIAFATNNAC